MNRMLLLTVCLLVMGATMLTVLLHGWSPLRQTVPEPVEIAAEIEGLASDDAARCGRSLRISVRRLCGRIESVSNRVEEIGLLRLLASTVLSLRPYDGTATERESMSHEYWQVVESVAYRLARGGASEGEVGDFILAGFSAYRKTCLSFGDADDMSDGTGAKARERRRCARGLQFAWENDRSFFERHSIGMIFHDSPMAAKRFLKRWREMFGTSDGKSVPFTNGM